MTGSKATGAKTPPTTGEQTKRQASMVGSFPFIFKGFGKPPIGTFDTYREMRMNPSIAMARVAATLPVRSAEWSIVSDDDAPEGAKKLIEDCFDQHTLKSIVRENLRALDYGFHAHEVVWMRDRDGNIVPKKFKPLLPDITQIMVTKDHGNYAGLTNDSTYLAPPNTMLFTYDQEAGNLYGRSRNENVRIAWHWFNQLGKRVGTYTEKIAGVIPMIEYDPTTCLDNEGNEISAYEAAKKMMQSLAALQAVIFPRQISGQLEDLLKAGQVKVDDLYSFRLKFLETKGTHEAGFDTLFNRIDKYLFRGWLVPERAISEGKHGNKADAEAHGELVLLEGEEILEDNAQIINWHIIDKVLRYNFGESACGTVRAEPGQLIDENRDMVRAVISALLSDPSSRTAIANALDLDSMVKGTGLPLTGIIPEIESTQSDGTFPFDPFESRSLENQVITACYTGMDRQLNGTS